MISAHERCGSNYVGDLLRLHPTINFPGPLWEDFLLHEAQLLEQYVETTAGQFYHHRFTDRKDYHCCVGELKHRIGNALQGFLMARPGSATRLFTKTPNPRNLRSFYNFFPDSQLVLLVRDGRDMCESAFRSWRGNCKAMSRERWIRQWARNTGMMIDFMTSAVGKHRQSQQVMKRHI